MGTVLDLETDRLGMPADSSEGIQTHSEKVGNLEGTTSEGILEHNEHSAEGKLDSRMESRYIVVAGNNCQDRTAARDC